jgi:hypothetical protein
MTIICMLKVVEFGQRVGKRDSSFQTRQCSAEAEMYAVPKMRNANCQLNDKEVAKESLAPTRCQFMAEALAIFRQNSPLNFATDEDAVRRRPVERIAVAASTEGKSFTCPGIPRQGFIVWKRSGEIVIYFRQFQG